MSRSLSRHAAALRSARIRLLAAFAASEQLDGWKEQLNARREANATYLAEVAQIAGQPFDIHGRPVADILPARGAA